MARPRVGESTWMGARPTPTATGLLVAVIASYLVLLFVDAPQRAWLVAHLGLLPHEALGPRPWQFLTSWVLHTNFASVVGDAIGIWIFATVVEQQLGRTKMLAIFAASQLLGALAFAALGRILGVEVMGSGCGHGVMGLVVAFGVCFSAVPMRLFGLAEMRGRTMALLILCLSFFVAILNRDWLALAADGVGAGVGLLMVTGGGVASLELYWNKLKLKRMRRRYRIISGGRDSSKSYLN